MKKKIVTAIAFLIIIGLSGTGSYYLGFESGLKQTKNIVIEGLKGTETPGGKNIDFSVFWQVWDKLKKEHVNGDRLKDQDLVYGAIQGLTKSTDDPHTLFFSPEDSQKFTQDISGSFGGIGAEIGIRNEQLIVIAPLKNTPAEKAGLRAKDKILKIDDTVTNDLTVDEAVKLIRGDIGTRVVLNIFRDEWEKSKDIEIIRAKVDVPTVDWSIKDGGVLYLQLYNFNGNTGLVFYKTMMDALSKGGIRGIVLDLRNNPGGYLDIAVDLAGWFLEKGDIVAKERFADGQERIFKANGNKALKGIPLVALINGGSASASEILAGALKVNRGIKLIGEKSFGKGTVQELQELKDGSTLKITIANWLLPDNSMIEKIGLTPDVEIKLTDEDFEAKKDPQLDKALEILRAEIAK